MPGTVVAVVAGRRGDKTPAAGMQETGDLAQQTTGRPAAAFLPTRVQSIDNATHTRADSFDNDLGKNKKPFLLALGHLILVYTSTWYQVLV